ALLFIALCGGIIFRVPLSERSMLSSLVLVFILVLAGRALSYRLMRRPPFLERALIIGASPITNKLIAAIEGQPHCRYAVAGIADDGGARTELPARYPLLGPLAHLPKIIEEVRPDRIIVGLTERRGRLPVHHLLESRVRGTPVEDGVNVYERLTGKLAIEALAPSALVFSPDFRKGRLDLGLGRLLSLVVSMAGLVVTAPLFAVVAIAIKLDSAGPVFFVQERVGLQGRRFKLVKFRTMRPVTDPKSEWARDNSERITPLGKWLRKFRVDELPQFVNIL